MLGSMSRRGLGAVALLAAAAVGLIGCGTASAPSPPTGVDQLVIPTPTPDPGDFVVEVDNPWFPLPTGRSWAYDVADVDGRHPLQVKVAPGVEIGGVSTTARVVRERGRTTTDWYAQDTAGNVWWLGREGEWRAGEAGAQAGVAMPAEPRLGDGYRMALAGGVVADHATVTEVEDDRVVVEVERSEPGPEPSMVARIYARNIGLVEESDLDGAARTVRLRR